MLPEENIGVEAVGMPNRGAGWLVAEVVLVTALPKFGLEDGAPKENPPVPSFF